MHGNRLPAGKAVRALPVSMRLHLRAADQGAGGARAERVELFDPAARGLGPCRVKPMKTPAPPSRSLEDLRELTPARVGLGRSGASLPTDALLAFTLDHARARDAVHTAFDAPHLVA